MASLRVQLLGVIGWPVSHSLSPAMHNAAAAALKMDVAYLPLPVRAGHLKAALRGLAALGFLGVNVTVPHKEAVMLYLDEIENAARAIGAVNTILFSRTDSQLEVKLRGYNTDWSGFLADLRSHEVHVQGRDCFVLGAGGSARAIAYALAHSGAQVHVFARRPAQAQRLAADLGPYLTNNGSLASYAWVARSDVSETPALIVNCTPAGMSPRRDNSPWPQEIPIPAGAFVYDLVYNPPLTRFMLQAQAAGCRTSNGLGMLVQQGALAFEIWTGRMPDLQIMRAALG